MTSISMFRWSRRRTRDYILWASAALVLIAGYLAFLEYEEQKMERYYAGLRETRPALYLSKLAQLHGFARYLHEFTTIRHYDQPHRRVPPFLLGRWALFEAEKPVGDHYFPNVCVDGVAIEDGAVRMFGAYSGTHSVTYRMDGDTVLAERSDGGPFVITPHAYGAHVHHIEIALPGHAAPLYGYICK